MEAGSQKAGLWGDVWECGWVPGASWGAGKAMTSCECEGGRESGGVSGGVGGGLAIWREGKMTGARSFGGKFRMNLGGCVGLRRGEMG
jgi:hypothetical protein